MHLPITACPEPQAENHQTLPSAESEERDRWWGSYAGRAMLPAFVLLGLFTALLLGFGWYRQVWHGQSTARHLGIGLTALLWLLQGFLLLYRILTMNYRLTSRRLFIERGFGHPNYRFISLVEVGQISVERSRWERWLRIGRVRITPRAPNQPPLVLLGVIRPDHVAVEIRKEVEAARAEGRATEGAATPATPVSHSSGPRPLA